MSTERDEKIFKPMETYNTCSNCGHAVEWAEKGVMGSGSMVYTVQGVKEALCNYCLRAALHPWRLFWRRHAPRFLVKRAQRTALRLSPKYSFDRDLPPEARTADKYAEPVFTVPAGFDPKKVGDIVTLLSPITELRGSGKAVPFHVVAIDPVHVVLENGEVVIAVDRQKEGGWFVLSRVLHVGGSRCKCGGDECALSK